MRYSKQRETILDAVKGTTCHPTAEWVYNKVKADISNISLGTVYRNLKLLSDNKDIETLETVDNCLHYDGDLSEHMHFICFGCGGIIDLFMQSEMTKQLIDLGYQVSRSKAVFYGKCSQCNKNSQSN